ncbi:MAG: aryl-sulfate sulfotransferase [Planctomycetota bacterium JB042]
MTHRSTSLALLVALAATPALAQDEAPRGLIRNEPGALDGYTLFTPLRGRETHLIDMEGEIVATWESEWLPGQSVYLLPNGNLLRCCRAENRIFSGGGEGGRLAEYDREGNLVWEYVCSDESRRQHHDAEPLPNGNVLLIAWEIVSRDGALALGRDEELLGTGHWWPDCVLEVKPTPPKGGEIVWEWHAKDHLIQDRDPEKPNHGDPAAHPERIDVNADAFSLGDAGAGPMTKAEEERLRALGYVGGDDDRGRRAGRDRGRGRRDRRSDWMHTNSVAYNAALDQIVLSVKTLGEIWIIDHGTTTEEAAGPKGDLLYRWGNPAAWSAGPVGERRLFGQHDARWVRSGDGWNLTVYNNGRGRPEGDWSSVDEIALPLAADGTYRRAPGRPFGPESLVWTYAGTEDDRFYSSFISGAERLPNGNTLVCVGEKGEVFEVTRDGEVVWEWHCPIAGREPGPGGDRPPRGDGPPPGDRPPPDRAGGGRPGGHSPYGLFRATRIPKDAPALAGWSLGERKSF